MYILMRALCVHVLVQWYSDLCKSNCDKISTVQSSRSAACRRNGGQSGLQWFSAV